MGHPLWPLFDLRLRTDRLVLRLPTDDDLVDLAATARAGIHPPDEMPFGIAWTDKPSPQFERESAQHHWLARATWSPERWNLHLAVFLDGSPSALRRSMGRASRSCARSGPARGLPRPTR